MTKKSKEQIIKEYKVKSDALIVRMHRLVQKVYRMIDDKRYREALEKFQKTTHGN